MDPEMPQFEDPRTVLKRYGFFPKHSWGQNFLISSRVVDKIAREAVDEEGRKVVEIGAGVGTLTAALMRLGGRVTAIERDRDMCEVLKSEFEGRDEFELAQADAKTFDYSSRCFSEPTVIAGNLPYQLTGPLLRRIMNIQAGLLRAVIMVQEEVANRITASAGEKARGALSVMVQARFAPKIVLRIPPTAFFPRPKVRSAVVVLEKRIKPLFCDKLSAPEFDKVVKAAFSSRRKYLRNALLTGSAGTELEIDSALGQSNIDPKLRPEKLTCDEYAALTFFLKSAHDLGSL